MDQMLEAREIKLYTSNGTLISTSLLHSNNQINIQSLKRGLYFIKVKTRSRIEMHRFIKN